jgi:hypothetical protein
VDNKSSSGRKQYKNRRQTLNCRHGTLPKNSNIRQARNPYVILTFLSGLESYKCPFISVGFSSFRETPIGKRHEVGTGDGGVLAWRFPSYNSFVITETLLKPTSSLDSLLER